MPYKLRKAPKRDLYWVVNTETKEKYSKEPLPKEDAAAQMRALYANTKDLKGGNVCGNCGKKKRRLRGGNLEAIGREIRALTNERGQMKPGLELQAQRALLKIKTPGELNHASISLGMKDLWYALMHGKISDNRLGKGPARSEEIYKTLQNPSHPLAPKPAIEEYNKAQGPSKPIVSRPKRFTYVFRKTPGFGNYSDGAVSPLGWADWSPTMERIYKGYHEDRRDQFGMKEHWMFKWEDGGERVIA